MSTLIKQIKTLYMVKLTMVAALIKGLKFGDWSIVLRKWLICGVRRGITATFSKVTVASRDHPKSWVTSPAKERLEISLRPQSRRLRFRSRNPTSNGTNRDTFHDGLERELTWSLQTALGTRAVRRGD